MIHLNPLTETKGDDHLLSKWDYLPSEFGCAQWIYQKESCAEIDSIIDDEEDDDGTLCCHGWHLDIDLFICVRMYMYVYIYVCICVCIIYISIHSKNEV